jgi:hypothetical protein
VSRPRAAGTCTKPAISSLSAILHLQSPSGLTILHHLPTLDILRAVLHFTLGRVTLFLMDNVL